MRPLDRALFAALGLAAVFVAVVALVVVRDRRPVDTQPAMVDTLELRLEQLAEDDYLDHEGTVVHVDEILADHEAGQG